MNPTGKALVLGHDNGSFLGVVRALGRRGIDVHIAWCPADAPAARSRYVRQAHGLPRPSSERGWIDAFGELMRRERFDLVVPTNDPTLIPLQLARRELEPLGRIYLLDDRAFTITFDKVRTRELAIATGVPVAPGQIVGSADELDDALRGRPYPLVIKPEASFTAEDLERRNSVTRVYDEAAARRAAHERLAHGQVVVEENVTGIGWGVEVLAADGEILLSQQHERLHEPLHGGGSTYRRTVPRHPAFMDAVTRLVRALSYTGVAMFEFKGDPDSGRWILIEINGRFWGSLPLSLAAGIDFPYGLWQLLVDGRCDLPDVYRTGVYARNLKRDLKWMWLNLRADRSDPVLATVPLRRVLGEVTHVVGGHEHADQFPRDDPAPGVAEFAQTAHGAAARATSLVAAKPPLRRPRQRRARAALAQAGDVLFVCYGNICRSPFAAGVARTTLSPTVTIRSAGTSGDTARRSPSIARRVAREFGVDLDGHRSRPLTADDVAAAEAIFVFDERNHRDVRRRFPQARGKVHLLGALSDDGPLIVDDPIDGGEQEFRRVYAEIAHALRSHSGAHHA